MFKINKFGRRRNDLDLCQLEIMDKTCLCGVFKTNISLSSRRFAGNRRRKKNYERVSRNGFFHAFKLSFRERFRQSDGNNVEIGWPVSYEISSK